MVAASALCGAVSADCDTVVAASALCGAVSADCDTVVAASALCGAVSADCDTVVAASALCGAVSADCDTVVAASALCGAVSADCDTVVAASALCGAVSADCDTVVAASALCGAVSADSPKFGCDSDDYFYGTQYDVDYSDYSDYDEYDELNCYSDVYGGVDPANYFAPNDMEFYMHALHGPDNCGVYCQLRYEIRPYGHYAPTANGELSRGMNDPTNYYPGPGKISPESWSVMAMSDSVSDIDPGPRGPCCCRVLT